MAALRAVHAIYQDEKLIFADRGAIPENGSEVIVTFFINKSRPEDMMTTDPLMELRGRGKGENLVKTLLKHRSEDREKDKGVKIAL